MSLVHEALQKAEREKQRKNGIASIASPLTLPTTSSVPDPRPVNPTRTLPAPTPANQPVAGKSSSVFLTALISCVAVVALVAIVFLVKSAATTIRESQHVIQQSPAPVNPTELTATTTTRAEPRPPVTEHPPEPVADSRWKLTGIMTTPEGSYAAVLNGKVVYETHYVDGAIVKKIERDRVTLDVNGKETVVRLF